jgi:multidrug efflux pump subunit AcrA (membrane-fusion protein)
MSLAKKSPATPEDRERAFSVILQSEQFRKAAEAEAAERLAERKRQAARLAELDKKAETTYAKDEKALAEASAELQAARAAVQQAEQKFLSLRAARTAASFRLTAERDELERALKESSSPLIAEFISWCWDEQRRIRVMKFGSLPTPEIINLVTGRVAIKTDAEPSLPELARRRMEALRDAVAEAEPLHLLADQSDIGERLTKLRTSLPEISL